MKKIILLFTFMALIGTNLQSQVLINSGFENWTDSTHATGWNSLNQTIGVPPFAVYLQSLKRTTDKRSGNYAAKLTTKTIAIISQTIPGFVNLGNVDLASQEISGGIPCTGMPTKLSGYYKFSPSGGDTMLIAVILYKYNTTTQQSEEIGYGVFMNNTATPTYTYFENMITYDVPNVAPDTMDIIMISSATETPHDGSTLYVDDLVLDVSPLSINENSSFKLTVSPNPANDIINVNLKNVGTDPNNVIIYNLAGQMVYNSSFTSSQFKINVANLNEGIYFIKISNNNTHKIKKFIVKHNNE
jgi:hypothetical protein